MRRTGENRKTEQQNMREHRKVQLREDNSTHVPAPVPLWKDLAFLLAKMLGILLLLGLTFTFLFGIFQQPDASMNPAVKAGDLIIYYRLPGEYTMGDVVVVSEEGELTARRVLAVEGDKVDITEEGLLINGGLQEEKEIYADTVRYEEGVDFPLTVGKGEVFVLGDARENARDSRIYGCVGEEEIKGKVITLIRRRSI